MPPLQIYELNNFELQCGIVMPKLELAYRVYGQLNFAKDNVVLFPTYYTGSDLDNARIIGGGHALNPRDYFIVVPNMFGNGVSSSPSNMPEPFAANRFPEISLFDNVRAQALLLESLNIHFLELVLGWSMGGMQTYQWCVQYPAMVKRALIICATAKASEHNQVFLEGVKAALTADQNYRGGEYGKYTPNDGLKAFGRVYAGWAYSQAFFRKQRYKQLGFYSVEDFLQDWEQDHLNWDANDLLTMLRTWQKGDISDGGDFEQALKSISAQVVLMPCEQDLYFRYEDNLAELELIKNGRYMGFESDYGHCSAGPGRFKEESDLIDKEIRELLTS